MPGCQAGQGQRRGVDVIDAFGLWRNLIGGGHGQFGVGRRLLRKVRHAEHLIANLEAGNIGAKRLDGSGNVPAEDEGRLAEQRIVAAAHRAVDRVDAGGADADQHFAGLRRRVRPVGDDKDVGTADGILGNGTHERLLDVGVPLSFG